MNEHALSLTATPLEVDRKTFLGGTDAAAVMGLSPWQTPVELWAAKTGKKDKSTQVPSQEQQRRWARGHVLEPFIRQMTIQRLRDMGLEVELVDTNHRYIDDEYPFLACEIDWEMRLTGTIAIGGEEVTFDHEHVNADAKSVHGFARRKWGDADTEDVPIEYAAQFMHGLGITKRRFCLVAALASFDDVDIFWTRADDETIAAMRAKCVQFWNEHVLTNEPPDPVVFDDIKALFPTDDGTSVEANESIRDDVLRLAMVKAEQKKLTEEQEALEFRIAEWIAPHARLSYKGNDLMTWKGQNDTRIDQARLKAEQPELFARYLRTKVVRVLRFVITRKGKQ